MFMVTNCYGERSFSKLKFTKIGLRTRMSRDRLGHLALMSIEYDILIDIDFNKITKDFASVVS